MALQKYIKAISICKALGDAPTKLTPKEFMMHYLTSDNADLAEALGAELKRTAVGKQAWTNFIQKYKAINILVEQEPPRGPYPAGWFQSSSTVVEDFLLAKHRKTQDATLVMHMPFLHNILMGMIPAPRGTSRDLDKDGEAHSVNGDDSGFCAEGAPNDPGRTNLVAYQEPLDCLAWHTVRFTHVRLCLVSSHHPL
ncbi:hypothetical protein PGT21_030770 [Puccinia graminis f. sp. tritici]|uniref:Uncharacterized protein n=1 Tax=Puccinia graminis f. sp. tritici TaxID=56615 RepID=A0A5B0PKT3_PUCGR|nr:hypothetical protein PGT21_030770 [Puccinia graminis f. sp. tritici]